MKKMLLFSLFCCTSLTIVASEEQKKSQVTQDFKRLSATPVILSTNPHKKATAIIGQDGRPHSKKEVEAQQKFDSNFAKANKKATKVVADDSSSESDCENQ